MAIVWSHNFGHGQDTLASVLAVLNLLAFALHAACDLTETLWQQARQRLGARARMVRAPPQHHLLSGLPLMDRAHVSARHRRPATAASLTQAPPPIRAVGLAAPQLNQSRHPQTSRPGVGMNSRKYSK